MRETVGNREGMDGAVIGHNDNCYSSNCSEGVCVTKEGEIQDCKKA